MIVRRKEGCVLLDSELAVVCGPYQSRSELIKRRKAQILKEHRKASASKRRSE